MNNSKTDFISIFSKNSKFNHHIEPFFFFFIYFRYAILRRRHLVDPHVSKDGSSSPDIAMDNPLSQNPGKLQLLIPGRFLDLDAFGITRQTFLFFFSLPSVNWVILIHNGFLTFLFHWHWIVRWVHFAAILVAMSIFASNCHHPVLQIACGVASFGVLSWRKWLTRIYHVYIQNMEATSRRLDAKACLEEFYCYGAFNIRSSAIDKVISAI